LRSSSNLSAIESLKQKDPKFGRGEITISKLSLEKLAPNWKDKNHIQ
jgi:hypothetical protein